MSFYKQPLIYQCGPFALKYALVMLGKMEDEKEIEELAGSTWWRGTDEFGLKKAANHYECDFDEIYETSSDKAIEQLNAGLKKGMPTLLCVDKWSHWITAIKVENNKYICVDSGYKKVIIIISEYNLLRRWRHMDKKTTMFSGFTVHPWGRVSSRAKFTIECAKNLMSDKYEDLALHWDSYFKVLAETTRSKNPMAEYTITFKEFLRRNQKMIVELVADWQGEIEYQELDMIFKNFLFVAEVYNMVIHIDDEKKAIITFASVLMLFATSIYGTYSYL